MPNTVQRLYDHTRLARARSYDKKTRSVEIILSTNTPCEGWDGPEILKVDGIEIPESGQVPLLNCHSRWSAGDVIGSIRELRVEDDQLIGRAFFADTRIAREVESLVRDKHLTDFSIGADVIEHTDVSEGDSLVMDGVTYEGPCLIYTKSRVVEGSAVPIGADPNAIARAAAKSSRGDRAMPKPKRRDADDEQLQRADGEPEERMDDEEEEREDDSDEERSDDEEERMDDEEDEERMDDEEKRSSKPRKTKTRKASGRNERQNGVQEERNRVTSINRIGAMSGVSSELVSRAINDGWSHDRALAEFEKDYKKRMALPDGLPRQNGNGVTQITRDAQETFAEGALDGMLLRAGRQVEKPRGAANEYREMSIVDVMREFLDMRGVKGVYRKSAVKIVSLIREGVAGARNTPGDFSSLFGEFLNKSLLEGFTLNPTSWRQISVTIPGKDMRDHHLYRRFPHATLARLSQGTDRLPQGTLPDGKREVLTPYAWARMIEISDDVFINDDMGAISNDAAMLGAMADQTINGWVWYTLLSNPTMLEDNTALFHADHNNLYGDLAPNATNFDTIFADFATRLATGSPIPLNLRPTRIISPVGIRSTVNTFLNSEYVPGGTNETLNVFKGSLEPMFEPLLDTGVTVETNEGEALTVAGSSSTYYITTAPSGPGGCPAVAVAFVGSETPTVESARPMEYLATQHRVHLRFGAALADWRGVSKIAYVP